MNTVRLNFISIIQIAVTSITNSLLEVMASSTRSVQRADYLKALLLLPSSELSECFIATNCRKTYISRSEYERYFSHLQLSTYNEIVGEKWVKREYFDGELEVLGIKEGENIILEVEIYIMDRQYEGILIGREMLDEMDVNLNVGEEGGVLEAEGV